MAYSSYPRKVYRKRKPYKRYVKRAHGAVDLAAKAWKMAKFVKGMVNTEHKFFDTALAASVDNTGMYFVCPNLIAQGNDSNNREGRSILAKSLYLRLMLRQQALTDFVTIRCMLIQDNAAVGAFPTMSDVLTTITTDAAVTSFRNILTGTNKRYKFLMDKRITIDKDTAGQMTYEKYFKLNHHIHFINTTGVIGAVGAGSLSFVFVATGATAGTTGVDIILSQARLRYIDN